MLKKLLFITFFLFGFFTISAQEISGKVIDFAFKKAIENVAIQTSKEIGTVSNTDGSYTISAKKISYITFSKLGFETKTLSLKDLEYINFLVVLKEKSTLLKGFQLNIAKISLDSLLFKTQKSMEENYLKTPVQQDIFVIDDQKMDFKKLNLDLKSSSILNKQDKTLAEEELDNFAKEIKQNKANFTREYKAIILSKDFYIPKTEKTFSMVRLEKAAGFKKEGFGEDLTLDNIIEKLQNIVLKHLNKNVSFKLKSGFFKVEDSLSFKKVKAVKDSIDKENSFSNTNLRGYKNKIKANTKFFEENKEKNFLNRKYYKHFLEKNELLGTNKYYVVSFQPIKSKSKFAGKIYINPKDFSIRKIDYHYAENKKGNHINLKFLFGVKFSENIKNCTIYFEKTESGKIYESYFKNSTTSYAFLNRPLKFIENSKEKNKVKFNIQLEINVTEGLEMLFLNTTSIEDSKIKPLKKEDFNKRTNYLLKEEYANSNWKERQKIIEYLEKYK
ncbi:carboxypeptidase-like regulatory domain-containing protein [uncultured Polaribacter sp.]|uniref:carboxypeptidase-like regulatory domain-containing protein n=1 Tax=uncultured Polaribacter sp. TaxID=174711 RepID=UPI00262F52DD|nr:carboxypeptidase-like regulatory domain-containing protein [uncultured Polaribacter sp.]